MHCTPKDSTKSLHNASNLEPLTKSAQNNKENNLLSALKLVFVFRKGLVLWLVTNFFSIFNALILGKDVNTFKAVTTKTMATMASNQWNGIKKMNFYYSIFIFIIWEINKHSDETLLEPNRTYISVYSFSREQNFENLKLMLKIPKSELGFSSFILNGAMLYRLCMKYCCCLRSVHPWKCSAIFALVWNDISTSVHHIKLWFIRLTLLSIRYCWSLPVIAMEIRWEIRDNKIVLTFF